MHEEAQCPYCDEWSAVEFDPTIPPGGFWWKDSADCPKCGESVLVETECNFRRATAERETRK